MGESGKDALRVQFDGGLSLHGDRVLGTAAC